MQCTVLSARDEFDRLVEFFDALAEEHQVVLSCAGAARVNADPVLPHPASAHDHFE